MNVLVVGDVHGCYHTFKKLIEEHWNPDVEFLIQVGDLINKGKRSGKTYLLAKDLEERYPHLVFFLKGNHEVRFIDLHKYPGKDKVIDKCKADFLKRDINLKAALKWFQDRPLKWENPNILITHAGISKYSKDPFGAKARRGVLHNRGALKNIGKLQVHGHLMQSTGQPVHKKDSNSWCIDTAAWTGKFLTGIRLTYGGEFLETVQVPTAEKDR